MNIWANAQSFTCLAPGSHSVRSGRSVIAGASLMGWYSIPKLASLPSSRLNSNTLKELGGGSSIYTGQCLSQSFSLRYGSTHFSKSHITSTQPHAFPSIMNLLRGSITFARAAFTSISSLVAAGTEAVGLVASVAKDPSLLLPRESDLWGRE